MRNELTSINAAKSIPLSFATLSAAPFYVNQMYHKNDLNSVLYLLTHCCVKKSIMYNINTVELSQDNEVLSYIMPEYINIRA